MALALIAASICTRLGVPAAITRATPKPALIDGECLCCAKESLQEIRVQHLNQASSRMSVRASMVSARALMLSARATPEPGLIDGQCLCLRKFVRSSNLLHLFALPESLVQVLGWRSYLVH